MPRACARWSRSSTRPTPGARAGPGAARRASVARATFRFAVPQAAQREFFGNAEYARLFDASVERLRSLGGEAIEVDITPLLEAARLLYEGPWVAERYLATESLLISQSRAPCSRSRAASSRLARRRGRRDAFRAQYRLKELIREARAHLGERPMCCCCPPPARTYRIAEIEAEPIALNSRLGTYTNFVNLMDLAAVAVPAGFTGARPALRRLAHRAGLERRRNCWRSPRACSAPRSTPWAPRRCRCHPPNRSTDRCPRASST